MHLGVRGRLCFSREPRYARQLTYAILMDGLGMGPRTRPLACPAARVAAIQGASLTPRWGATSRACQEQRLGRAARIYEGS